MNVIKKTTNERPNERTNEQYYGPDIKNSLFFFEQTAPNWGDYDEFIFILIFLTEHRVHWIARFKGSMFPQIGELNFIAIYLEKNLITFLFLSTLLSFSDSQLFDIVFLFASDVTIAISTTSSTIAHMYLFISSVGLLCSS